MTNTSIFILPGTILSLLLTVSVALFSLHLKDIFTATSLSGSLAKSVDSNSRAASGITSSHDIGIDFHNHIDKQTSRSILNLPKVNSLQSDARSLQRVTRSEAKKILKRHNGGDGWRHLFSVFAS